MRMSKPLYKIKTCPSDDPEQLERLLNEMSQAGWDLYTLHEVEGENGYCYNCIFVTESESEPADTDEDEIAVFKTRMEKILTQDSNPYSKCVDIQKKIRDKREKIQETKLKLEEAPLDRRSGLNNQMSELINELSELKKQLRQIISPESVLSAIGEEKLSISLAEEILELIDPDKGAVLVAETVHSRQKIVENLGYIIPKINFHDDDSLEANEFCISVHGIKTFRACVYPDCKMFYADELSIERLPKGSTRDNDVISGREVVWIPKEEAKDFWAQAYTPQEYIAKALEFVCIRNIEDLFDYGDLNRYVDIVVEKNPYLIENSVPEFISLAELKYLLVNLIKEQVSIKDIIYIFEKINDFSDETVKDDLIDKIRVALSKQISSRLADDTNTVSAIQISSDTIDEIINLMDKNEQTIVRVDGSKLKVIIEKLLKTAEELEIPRDKIVLMAPLEVRHMVAMIMLQLIPNLRVIAEEEISADYATEILAVI